MKYFSDSLSRLVALLVLIPFVLVSCPMSFSPPPAVDRPPTVVITPGEGDARYMYLNAGGEAVETDEGITGFYIENNPNAAGVAVVSDDTGSGEDVVLVRNPHNDSTVAIYFKKGANFPHYMAISLGEEKLSAYLSQYRPATESYDITFEQDGEYETLKDLVLNDAILDLYQDDGDLTDSQNRRLGNIVRALGLWGSLAASLENAAPDDGSRASLGRNAWTDFWSPLVKKVAKVFTAVAAIATVVAVVVAPIISLISPVAGLIVKTIMETIAVISTEIAAGFTFVSTVGDMLFSPVEPGEFILNVTLVGENRWITNGEEFHIGRGQEILLKFSSPGMNAAEKRSTINDYFHPYQPGVTLGSNAVYFTITTETGGASDEFLVRIKRAAEPGYSGDGRIAYNFKLANKDHVVNNNSDGVLYKLPGETAATIHKDMVVVWFCISPSCPNYVD